MRRRPGCPLLCPCSSPFWRLERGRHHWLGFSSAPRASRVNPPRASTRPLPLPCARGARSPPVFVSSFSKLFHSVSDLGMGCGNKSGLFAVFYHLMMANHRLLDCSHGNGSGFQHPASPRCAHSFSQRARDKCEGQRAGRGQLPAGCSCLLLQGVLLQGARLQPGACRSLPALLGACSSGAAWRLGAVFPRRSLPRGGQGPCGRGSSALPRAGTPRLRKTAEPGRGEACDGSWSIPWGTGGTTACLQA